MKIPESPPSVDELWEKMESDRILEVLSVSPTTPIKKYLHWDELRRRPMQEGFSHQEWWLKVKVGRNQLRREIPLKDINGREFSYCLSDAILEKLPIIDSQARGIIGISEQVVNRGERDRYVISSLIEEAITSSQLEGAVTTRKDAVEMLRSGRSPRDRSEQMILNNFRAMKHILTLKNEDMTLEKICELHRIVTEHTLDDEASAGQIQKPGDKRVAVWDDIDGQVLHHPPPAEQLVDRMQAMCDFANCREFKGAYLHPIVQAIILHFWLAYDHPFEDGNGRTARALFYWSMLRQDYWLFEFVSISSLIKKAPASYARSFLYTETDDNDLTYFIIHQLDVIIRAIKALESYIGRKAEEVQQIDSILKNMLALNHRQKALIAHGMKNPRAVYSIESHQRSHNIAYATSRNDLLKLLDAGLLEQFKIGKGLRFRPTADIRSRLETLD